MLTACTSGAPGPSSTTGPSSPLATSTPQQTATPGQSGGSLRFGLGSDPRSIDPRFAGDETSLLVVDALFDSLTSHGRNFFPVPSAAVAWGVSDDQLSWTFELDPEATFHDDRPVTATDFVRAFQRIVDGTATPKSFQAHLLEDVAGWDLARTEGTPLSGVVAVDDLTLRIDLVRPNADLASVLAHPSLAPVPAEADDDAAWAEQPIGNGPFQMVEAWAHNQFIRLARADDRARLDEVLFQIYANDPGHQQQYADFAVGQLHVAQVPPAELDAARQRFGSAFDGEGRSGVLDGPMATTYHYGFDTTRSPFDRPEVRRAVSLLLDRQEIAQEVMLGTRSPATSLLPPGLVGQVDGSCTWCQFEPEEAQRVLAEGQVGINAEEIGTIVVLHDEGEVHEQIAQRVAAAIEEALGLDVEVRSLSLRQHTAAIAAGEGHVFRLGWTSEHPLPSSYLRPQFHSRSIGTDNLTRFADPEVDRLLDLADREDDRRDRLELLAEVEARVADLVPVVPILTYQLQRVVSPDVQGFRMDALGRVDLTRVQLREPA